MSATNSQRGNDMSSATAERSMKFTVPYDCKILSVAGFDLPAPLELKAGQVATLYSDGSYAITESSALSETATPSEQLVAEYRRGYQDGLDDKAKTTPVVDRNAVLEEAAKFFDIVGSPDKMTGREVARNLRALKLAAPQAGIDPRAGEPKGTTREPARRDEAPFGERVMGALLQIHEEVEAEDRGREVKPHRSSQESHVQHYGELYGRAFDADVSAPTESASRCVAVPREPTEAMLIAARDWSHDKYGKSIGNDAAILCWQAMFDASHSERNSDK